MKKIILLLTISIFGLYSCTGPEGIPGHDGQDGYSAEAEVFEIRNVNFVPDSQGNYGIVYDLNPQILNSDMILVYRLSGIDQGEDVWKLQPENYYFDDGTLDFGYGFDFTKYDINIYMTGNDLSSVSSQYRLNQIFRVVIIPGYLSNRSQIVDVNDYNAVIKAYHISEQHIKTLK